MKLIKRLAAIAFVAGIALTAARAQGEGETIISDFPYNFVGIQGGVQLVPTDYDHVDLLKPIGGVQLGRFFSPEFGLRISAQGWQSRSGLASIGDTYHWAYATGDIDMLFNLSNIFSKTKYHKLSLLAVAGVGLNYAWDNDDLNNLVEHGVVTESNVENWDEHRFSHNLRVGAIVDYALTRNWGVNLELDANNLADRFNSKVNGHCDWQLTAMLGVNYKWGHRKHTVAAPAPEPEPEPEPEPAPVVKEPEPAPAAPVVLTPEERHLDIFFERGKAIVSEADEAQLQKLSEWIKQHKTGKILLAGYADKGTGTPRINKRLAAARANVVTDILVKQYGIPADQIEKSSHGDTVQPFADNDKNRVVRIDVKEEL